MPSVEITPKASVAPIDNRTTNGRFGRSSVPQVVNPVIQKRRQSAEESRQFSAALTLLLSELVRLELGCRREKK